MLDYYTRVGAVTKDDSLFSATLWRCWNFGSTFASNGFGSRPQGKDGVVFTRGAFHGSQKCVSAPPRLLAFHASRVFCFGSLRHVVCSATITITLTLTHCSLCRVASVLHLSF